MKTCYYYFYEGEFGEADAFFDENLKLIHYWDGNDANYRAEYMNSLFKHFGVKMEHLPKRFAHKAEKILEKEIGY